jgi:putative ABC transport system permease protein
MLFTIAWRNVWRSRRRSGILVASITVGICAALLEMAILNGMAAQQVDAAVRTRLSHLQVHAPGFREHEDVGRFLPGGDSLLAVVRSAPGVVSAAGRAVLDAMAASATTARGVRLLGVDPAAERRVSDLPSRIVQGDWFGAPRRNAAVIGERLARRLGIRLGQKVVLTAQGGDGAVGGGAFRIVGLYRTASSDFDESAVFVERADLARTFALDGRLYEIAVRVGGMDAIDPVAATLRDRLPGLEVATWRTLAPEVALTRDWTSEMNEIFLVVILVALVFGTTNTMLMGVLERTRELGVLLALGMRPARLFGMVVLETVLLSLVGGVAGTALAATLIAALSRTGIDLAAVAGGLAALGMERVIHPLLPASSYPGVVALVAFAAVAASLYPGWKAVRLDPVIAMRTYR